MNANQMIVSVFVAIAACIVGFVVFNIAYIEWAVWCYPHNNSMAGLAAFIYGIPVSLLIGLVTFTLLRQRFRKKRHGGPVDSN